MFLHVQEKLVMYQKSLVIYKNNPSNQKSKQTRNANNVRTESDVTKIAWRDQDFAEGCARLWGYEEKKDFQRQQQ